MAGYINIHWAILSGAISGIIGYFGCRNFKEALKYNETFKYDDTLDVFGIHGLVGIWGAIALSFFT